MLGGQWWPEAVADRRQPAVGGGCNTLAKKTRDITRLLHKTPDITLPPHCPVNLRSELGPTAAAVAGRRRNGEDSAKDTR